ncbi:DUF418 domain-containing protein [Alteraurantiacibacter aquimixticola]|uniref:DUF418 domain-containing protein n=1 Tax=Alteraurantiacibacter aquimixticola TaxID=2489173 RepID=A0A4T3F207_9SPHN|nr:DUF418 domain-containing protein [Alteraurantiacibacter aquimixticola]TIX51263.1 DUF418 domain-containing protein [Alteraurantiacibacter aquimixticola]
MNHQAEPLPPADAAGSPQPVAGGERLHSLDLVRGIAVLGILLANVVAFGHPDLAYFWPPALPGGGNEGDELVWLAQFVLVDGKFRGAFTMLFGAGMLLFIDGKGGAREGVSLQMRRLGWLALFGVAHFILLFRGDILFSYALAGLVALFFIRLDAMRLLAIGTIWAVAGALAPILNFLTPVLIEAGSSAGVDGASTYYAEYWATLETDSRMQEVVYSGDSYGGVLHFVLGNEMTLLASYAVYIFFETIPKVLLGMGLYRAGVFALGEGVPHWRGLAVIGVVAGLALHLVTGLYVMGEGFPPYLTQMAFFGLSGLFAIPLLLGAMPLLAQWAARPHVGWLAERLSLAGRMAFTNYIGTSLIMVLVFQGWAGGLYGQLHRVELLPVVLLGWALMIAFSRFWLAHFRYGPLEWLWRCLTYWRLFPNRLPRD